MHSTLLSDTYDTTAGPDLGKTITVSWHNIFHDNEYAKGFVKFPYGFTVNGENVYVSITEAVDGEINFQNNHGLNIERSLTLGQNSVWTSGPTQNDAGFTYGYPNVSDPYDINLSHDLTFRASLNSSVGAAIIAFSAYGTINGNGNHLFINPGTLVGLVYSSNHFNNLNIHNIAKNNFAVVSSLPTFRDVTFYVKDSLKFNEVWAFIEGNTKIIGNPGSTVICEYANFYINPDTTFLIGEGITLNLYSYGPSDNNSTIFFYDKTSRLHLKGCELSLGSTKNTPDSKFMPPYAQEYLQNTLTFSTGTIIIDGTVDVTTTRTGYISGGTYLDGFSLTWSASSLDTLFLPSSRLRIHDNVRIYI